MSFVASAAAVVLPSEPEYVQSLDGAWRFKLIRLTGKDAIERKKMDPAPITAPVTTEPFEKPNYHEDTNWVDLAVPGNWEMAGLSPATYYGPDTTAGYYRFRFTVPKSWKGREVRISFDGVQNGAKLWLNGQPVAVDESSWGCKNYHESGFTAFQADLTPQVRFGKKNLLALYVVKRTPSSDLDTGDYFFLGGVYRPVTLFAVPKIHLDDVTVQTHLLPEGRAELTVTAAVAGDAGVVAMQFDGARTEQPVAQGRAVFKKIVEHPRLWSAEFPNLYDLSLELTDARGKTVEKYATRAGLREVSITNGVLLLNGKPIKLAGVCRHDVSPSKGVAVGPDLWRKDITLMKAANINAIRTSHYPYGAGFYDLCDELGMYVMDELPYCWCFTGDPLLEPAFAQRARETIRRDKNHPSVLIWAIGNENKAGRDLQSTADLVKQLDPTRPRAVSRFDADKYHVELSDSHYTSAESIAKNAARSDTDHHPHIYLEDPNTWDERLAPDPGMWERWGILLQRIWGACLKYDTVPGTFIFEWQDRAVADPNSMQSYAEWHDTGVQQLTDYPKTGIRLLKMKGLVDGFRDPRPSLYEVKMIYSPIEIGGTFTLSSDKISFPVRNRYSFTDLSQLALLWKLERNGAVIASDDAHVNCAPLTAGNAEISLPADSLAQADALRVEFMPLDGNSVVAHRFTLKEAAPTSEMVEQLPPGLPIPQLNLVTRDTHKVKTLWRAVTWYESTLTNVVLDPPSAASLGQLKQMTADIIGSTNAHIVGHLRTSFDGGQFSYRIEWTGPAAAVQELGWRFSTPQDCDHFSWNRAARWTVYPDTDIGRAEGTATPDSMDAQLTRMDRPDAFDFDSTKYDCNWAALTTAQGEGMRVGFDPKQRFDCRAGRDAKGRGYVLFVNQYVSIPDDTDKGSVKDLILTLKRGDVKEGSFRVGSNRVLARQ